MSDQNTEKNNPNQPNTGQNKEGAFGSQSGKDMQQPPKKDVQNKEQNEQTKTGTR